MLFFDFQSSKKSIIISGHVEAKTSNTMAISRATETVGPLRLLRNSILEAEPYIVYQNYSLARCLDECLYRDTDL